MAKKEKRETTPVNDQEKDSAAKGNRREFIKKMGIAGAVGAATAVGGIMRSDPAQAADQADMAVRFNYDKLTTLAQDPEACAEYVAAVEEIVAQMLVDPDFANTIIENTEGVRLIKVFNDHRKNIEPFIGKVDGRTKEGRYKKIIHASELFHNVSGLDGVNFGENSEELMVYQAESEAVVSSSCSGCGVNDPAVLGCCIVHFWSWSEGGSCSPCNG